MRNIPLKSLFGRGRCSAIGAQLLFLFCAMLAVAGRAAETVVTAPAASSAASKVLARYEKVLAAARKDPPAPGTIICIGSSHMEFWKTASEDLVPLRVHNHGVGGSTMLHAAELFVDNLAVDFKPRAVLLYEGSNDIAAGLAPEEVLADFQQFHRKLHATLPASRLYVISIVPSPGKRFESIDTVHKLNALLRQECDGNSWMKFLDITTPLIGTDGQPKAECFIPGNIHMRPAGYAIWTSVIAPVVVAAEKPFERTN
jgi:lysophospholipase L1-like esterase